MGVCARARVCLRAHVCVCVCVCACICARVCARVCASVCARVIARVCVRACVRARARVHGNGIAAYIGSVARWGRVEAANDRCLRYQPPCCHVSAHALLGNVAGGHYATS